MAVLHQGKFPLNWSADLLAARVDEETLLFDLPFGFGLSLKGD